MNYPIGFVVALTREAQTLQTGVKPSFHAIDFHTNAKLFISGMGYENARLAAENLIQSGCKHLISWGSCAALSYELSIGDVIIPNTVIDFDNNKTDLYPDLLPSKIIKNNLVRSDTIYLHLDKVVCSESDKKQLHLDTNAVAGDMESLAVVDIAKQHNITSNIIRSVSDSRKTVIPYKITQHINQYGDLIFPDFYKALLLNPFSIPQLIQLGKGFKVAMNNLNLIKNELIEN